MSEPASGSFVSGACMLPRSCGILARLSSPRGRHRRRRYATNFLYNQRRPSWRRQTCPRTSRPVMLRLGMMTRRRCQVVGLAVRRSNPNLRMLMVGILIDAMLTHPAQDARCRHRPQRASRRPLIGFQDRRPCSRPREITLPRAIPFPIPATRES
jgi:hypothetical protein